VSLDDDLYTLFNTKWRAGNIRKPTFYKSAQITSRQLGDFFINTNLIRGDPTPAGLDRLFYVKNEYFILTFFEGAEADIALVENEVYYALANPITSNTLFEIYEDEPMDHQETFFTKILRGRRRQWVLHT